jgi:cytoskeletal protein CcmA (bactofilin family)
MSDPAVDLSIPVKPVGPSGPPLMPALAAESSSSASSVVLLETPFRPPWSDLKTDQVESRTMLVGAEVSLSAEISFCDRLVISGNLEASLDECRALEVAAGGSLKGNATVATAEIRGRFDGVLFARKGIVIHSTACVSGSITYGELEIKKGAQVAGILMPDQKAHKNSLPPAFATRQISSGDTDP